jgi:hypothetical protein
MLHLGMKKLKIKEKKSKFRFASVLKNGIFKAKTND